ncbi:hypothetical protein [Haliangium sp.]|uniref:hypothetical protein n=1 Tax=Haliangium sp. TaxID=2663208 RepID=UPI003D12FB59
MMRCALLLALVMATGCAKSFWCASYANGISGSECYPDKDSCEWNRERGAISMHDIKVSECEPQQRAYCFDAQRKGRSFEQCFPDESECRINREVRMKANEGTHTFTECRLEVAVDHQAMRGHMDLALR